jgi:hypothetical protein
MPIGVGVAANNVIFWLLAGPLLAVWLVLLVRYTAANKQWFESWSSSYEQQRARARRMTPPPRRTFAGRVVRAAVWWLRGEVRLGVMFEGAADPETEALRSEAVARYKPLLYIFAIGTVAVATLILGVTLFLLGVWLAKGHIPQG